MRGGTINVPSPLKNLHSAFYVIAGPADHKEMCVARSQTRMGSVRVNIAYQDGITNLIWEKCCTHEYEETLFILGILYIVSNDMNERNYVRTVLRRQSSTTTSAVQRIFWKRRITGGSFKDKGFLVRPLKTKDYYHLCSCKESFGNEGFPCGSPSKTKDWFQQSFEHKGWLSGSSKTKDSSGWFVKNKGFPWLELVLMTWSLQIQRIPTVCITSVYYKCLYFTPLEALVICTQDKQHC